MEYLNRSLDLQNITRKRSVFLLGPRQTGKTELIRHSIDSTVPFVQLLDSTVFLDLSQNPSRLREMLNAKNYKSGLVVIDEIQKLPALLDEVHLMLEGGQLRFLLTGSSAVKLRRAGVNLLGGRAQIRHLNPMIYRELGKEHFDLSKALNRGLLPSIYSSDEPRLDLRSYAGTYLEQEVASEASVRNIESFSRFLRVAAECNGQIINYTNIGSDAKVERRIVAEYFQILKDTLIGTELEPWKRTKKRKSVETSKFFFFDAGVARAIADKPSVKERSADYGEAFEQYIFHELKSWRDYKVPTAAIAYWRSVGGFEVDFILGNEVAVEVKAMTQVPERELKGIRALMEERLLKKYVVVSLEKEPRKLDDGIFILPYELFLDGLWNGEWAPDIETL